MSAVGPHTSTQRVRELRKRIGADTVSFRRSDISSDYRAEGRLQWQTAGERLAVSRAMAGNAVPDGSKVTATLDQVCIRQISRTRAASHQYPERQGSCARSGMETREPIHRHPRGLWAGGSSLTRSVNSPHIISWMCCAVRSPKATPVKVELTVAAVGITPVPTMNRFS